MVSTRHRLKHDWLLCPEWQHYAPPTQLFTLTVTSNLWPLIPTLYWNLLTVYAFEVWILGILTVCSVLLCPVLNAWNLWHIEFCAVGQILTFSIIRGEILVWFRSYRRKALCSRVVNIAVQKRYMLVVSWRR